MYRSRLLQVNTRWKALAEIYTMHSFAPFWNPHSKTGEKRTWLLCTVFGIHNRKLAEKDHGQNNPENVKMRGWPSISNLELCNYPLQDMRFRLSVYHISFFGPFVRLPRGKRTNGLCWTRFRLSVYPLPVCPFTTPSFSPSVCTRQKSLRVPGRLVLEL